MKEALEKKIKFSIQTSECDEYYEDKSICTLKVKVNAEQLAVLFWDLSDYQMADFFNTLDKIAGVKLDFQLAYVTENPKLKSEGRRVMSTIGDYARKEGCN